MGFHEDGGTNAENIQNAMEEVEETAEEERIAVPVNLNESLEADEEENDKVIEFDSNTCAIEKEEEEHPEVQKEVLIKPVGIN